METPLPINLPIGPNDEDVTMRDSPATAAADPIPIVKADTEKECPPSSTPWPPYTPQFSSASWILDFMKNDQEPSHSSLPNGSEAAPQTGDESKDGSNGHDGSSIRDTMTMPISPTHQPLGSAANIIAASQLIRMKRKREQDEEADDFTQNTMSLPLPAPTPALTPSATDILRFVPSYTDASDVINRRTGYSQEQSEMERRRAKNLAALPDDVVPAKEELVGFWPGHASDAALTEYFYGKTKTDVLNILSFCDQLKPQLLVDIMVSVAKKHPDLPIFDSPGWNAKALSAVSARAKHSHQSSRSATRLRHGHTVIESRAKHKHKTSKKTIKIAPIPLEEESQLMDYGDSLPPMWPKAGEGLYAKLSPEDEDRAFLLDENDEEAFSHFGVDKFGKQIAIPFIKQSLFNLITSERRNTKQQ
ncbi:uncharacterized protein Triagg1_311 [Trichoderma aggressivum f. europaeum]|uniref:Uncharacterized protein n=1 Tax=Trichoderma aggressivum f. europaeum TaxID=173218 RepID=A0AAE1IL69_9HYPO|nr:hypothetical protein Triagg1_311 [Trichoderma aggressivum f. europaeum]